MCFELGIKKAGAGKIVRYFARYYQNFTVKGTPYQDKIPTKLKLMYTVSFVIAQVPFLNYAHFCEKYAPWSRGTDREAPIRKMLRIM